MVCPNTPPGRNTNSPPAYGAPYGTASRSVPSAGKVVRQERTGASPAVSSAAKTSVRRSSEPPPVRRSTRSKGTGDRRRTARRYHPVRPDPPRFNPTTGVRTTTYCQSSAPVSRPLLTAGSARETRANARIGALQPGSGPPRPVVSASFATAGRSGPAAAVASARCWRAIRRRCRHPSNAYPAARATAMRCPAGICDCSAAPGAISGRAVAAGSGRRQSQRRTTTPTSPRCAVTHHRGPQESSRPQRYESMRGTSVATTSAQTRASAAGSGCDHTAGRARSHRPASVEFHSAAPGGPGSRGNGTGFSITPGIPPTHMARPTSRHDGRVNTTARIDTSGSRKRRPPGRSDEVSGHADDQPPSSQGAGTFAGAAAHPAGARRRIAVVVPELDWYFPPVIAGTEAAAVRTRTAIDVHTPPATARGAGTGSSAWHSKPPRPPGVAEGLSGMGGAVIVGAPGAPDSGISRLGRVDPVRPRSRPRTVRRGEWVPWS